MISKRTLRSSSAFALAFAASISGAASAAPSDAPPAAAALPAAPDPFAGGVAPQVPAPPAAPAPQIDTGIENAKFSGGRMAVEVLAGALVGGLAAAGTYAGLCNPDGNCVAAAWAGAAVDLIATPLVVSRVGGWMGGRGSLMVSYMTSVPAIIPMTVPSSPGASYSESSSDRRTSLVITAALMPVLAAVGYELSSQVRAIQAQRTAEWQRSAPPVTVGFVPLQGRGGLAGALSSLTLRF